MKRLAIFLLCLAALIAVTMVCGIVTIQSGWFREKVRHKIVSVVEDGSGGRVEIGAFEYDWRRLTASVAPFILHGTEAAADHPLFQARKVEVGLRIVSMLKRHVDVAFLNVDHPEVYIVVSSDGHTNLPTPKIAGRHSKSFVQELLDIKVGQFAMRDGWVEYNSQRIPLNVKADDVSARFRFEGQGPRYTGDVASSSLHLNSPDMADAVFNFRSKLALSRSGLEIKEAKFVRGKSEVEASGVIEDFASPHGTLGVKARLHPEDLNRLFRIPIANRGEVDFVGKTVFRFSPGFDWRIEGKASGHGLAYASKYVKLDNAKLSTSLSLRQNALVLTDLDLAALDGSFHGRLDIEDWKKLSINGEAKGFSVQALASLPVPRSSEVNGRASGPVQLHGFISRSGFRDVIANAKLTFSPGQTGVPVQGFVDVTYDQRANVAILGSSSVDVGASHLEASGTLGQELTVHATSRNLNDALAALPLVGQSIPRDLPVTLNGGLVRFDGTVSGPLNDPRIAGQVDATKFTVKGEAFDHLASSFELTHQGMNARSLTLSQGPFQLDGSGSIALANWQVKDSSAVAGSLSMRGAEIRKILEQRNSKIPLSGTLAATAEIKGTYGSPQATAGIDAENVTAYDEHLNRIRASVIVSGDTLRVIDARLQGQVGQILGQGTFLHRGTDWTTGDFRFDLTGRGLSVEKISHAQTFRKGLGGQLDFTAQGTARLSKGEFRVETITSETTLHNGSINGTRYGNVTLTANSRGTILDVKATANLLNTSLQGTGEWKMEGDDPGHGEIVIPRITIATLHELVPSAERKLLPFEGFLEGKIDINGPLRKPDKMTAEVHVNTLQLNASSGAQPRAGAKARDLILRNVKPILMVATTQGVDIRNAELTGTDTTLETQGRFSFDNKNPWDLRVKGSINLAILQIFNPNLLGSGISVVDATVRGTLTEPQVEGRLELKNASLYVTDLPNGLDQANGLILFDRNRATVDSLSATTGGGNVTIQKGSFVGFRGPAVVYRVQATADRVRYRSPEGVSITVNALLSLIGTSDNSVLGGTVTVVRAGFNPTTDIGGLLASTAKPISAPVVANAYLRGLQFDVRVESAQSLEIQTSLTRNIEAEANLRLRGTPERPVMLGNLTVNEGEIEFFGNRYRINRGEVNFYNPVKVEPNIDMDLETVVRGITVDITFSGPLNKLNFSYRSDPPLQTNDIIALLAVGRTPVTTGAIAASQAGSSGNYLGTGTNALLSQAISAPVAGRLQRFFGVSHIKIDPQLTDLTSVPQARLTLEQQISKEITLTYITNLTRTQEQIIRVEWDLNRQWSVIALRDENGAFGIDFQYRKRFK